MLTARPSSESQQLYEEAQRYLVGGASAAARIHPSLGRPFMTSRGAGGRVYDLEGNSYVDFNTSFGAALLGHGHPAAFRAIQQALEIGILCAHETEFHAAVARKITELVPSADLVRFTGSGTETTCHAVRTARAYTGKFKVVKFEGHFHGYGDSLGYSCWPGPDQWGDADEPTVVVESGGVPPAMLDYVIVLPWNDTAALERTLAKHGDAIAAVIMEPVNYNSGTLLPQPGYLETARELTTRHNVALIFDEILSGFRTGPDCIQGHYGVTPDITTLGKAVGGGTALSAFVGRYEVMNAVAPRGRAVHSGTFNAHPIPILAANAFLDEVAKPSFWRDLEALYTPFHAELPKVFERAGLPVWVNALGARFSLLFGLERAPHGYREAALWDRDLARRFFGAAMERGVYFHFAWHHGISIMHTQADLHEALEGIESAARHVAAGG